MISITRFEPVRSGRAGCSVWPAACSGWLTGCLLGLGCAGLSRPGPANVRADTLLPGLGLNPRPKREFRTNGRTKHDKHLKVQQRCSMPYHVPGIPGRPDSSRRYWYYGTTVLASAASGLSRRPLPFNLNRATQDACTQRTERNGWQSHNTVKMNHLRFVEGQPCNMVSSMQNLWLSRQY